MTLNEWERGGRIIGGENGDLWFEGFTLNDGKTTLHKPSVNTTLDLTQDEVDELAETILNFSYDAIGIETVEHS